MSKANQKARFSVVNLFDNDYFRLNNMDRALKYLDYDEIIAKIPQVRQALKDIKARKRDERSIINMMSNKGTWTRIHLRPPKWHTRQDYVQRGFNIVEKWKNEEQTTKE
jgi:hypothetical protein